MADNGALAPGDVDELFQCLKADSRSWKTFDVDGLVFTRLVFYGGKRLVLLGQSCTVFAE